MAQAGYNPHAAPRVWKGLIREQKASAGSAEPFIFFASHPASEGRFETLERLAEQAASAFGAEEIGRERFLEATLPLRSEWLRAELRQQRYRRTQVVHDRLLAAGVQKGELYAFQGELYRQRGREGDMARSIEAYQRALQFDGVPGWAHRSLGLAYWSEGQTNAARNAFKHHLTASSEAEDGAMVQAYIEQLQ